MKVKDKITEDNYKEVVLKRSIIICWVLLAICLVIKLFGGNFFGMVCSSEGFIKLCDFIEGSFIKYIIYILEFLLTCYCLIYIADGGFKFKSFKCLIYTLICILIWGIKLLLELDTIKLSTLLRNVFEFGSLYLLLFSFSKDWFKCLICTALLLVFSFVSAYIKSVGIDASVTENFIISQIFLVDYYIMLVMSALYSKLIYKRRTQ